MEQITIKMVCDRHATRWKDLSAGQWPQTYIQKSWSWFKDNTSTDLPNPDINPIEHLWVHVKWQLNKYQTPPKGVLERAVAEWTKICPETCQKLIESMPRRIEAVLKAKGRHPDYWFGIIEDSKIAPITYYSIYLFSHQFWFKSCDFGIFRAVTCYIITYIYWFLDINKLVSPKLSNIGTILEATVGYIYELDSFSFHYQYPSHIHFVYSDYVILLLHNTFCV